MRKARINEAIISPPIGPILGKRSNTRYTYPSLDENEGPTEEEPTTYICCSEPYAQAPIKTLDSCNGLVLCYSRTKYNVAAIAYKLYIVNPTTFQFTTLPSPPTPGTYWIKYSLAYNPYKSPMYWVYGVELSNSNSVGIIHEYSSNTGVWKLFATYNFDPVHRGFNGVFCNGDIHWICKNGYSYHFDVAQKSIQKLQKPPLLDYWESCSGLKYFGESHGNLHFIAVDTESSTFIIYEMQEDGSGWFLKYNLDIEDILAAFLNNQSQKLLPRWLYQQHLHKFCSVPSFVKVKNEGPKLVMRIPGKITCYSFKDNTFKKLHDFRDKYAKYKAFKFNGTWSCI